MMETLIENIVIYSAVFIFCFAIVLLYLRREKRKSRKVEEKIRKAKEEGLYEPVSLHPMVDPGKCIGTGACITACPEKDILGIVNGKATTINTSRCIGHGACFHACPTKAITLVIGSETRGVELPHVNSNFETNVPGIFIAGELGGMGLIRNAVEQGRQAVEHIAKAGKKPHAAMYDLIIVGAGPAGIAASLAAKKLHLSSLTLDQDTLGGTVYSFPRSKIVMTSPMDLPLYGKVKLHETSKHELLELWKDICNKHTIPINENSKVESVTPEDGHFRIVLQGGEQYTSQFVLLAIGRRGSPRKLGVPGEDQEKVAYRLLEPEHIKDKEIIVVGGGDSAIEAALSLAGNNHVILSYRGETFSRIKPGNQERIAEASSKGLIDLRFNTNLVEIGSEDITLTLTQDENSRQQIKNDLVFIFAGGELPTQFLTKTGITVTKKFGEAVLKHG
jgi:thioredoxin reductase/Pyruvate/2-oxoacid:ferredoxin oxidoreductase delta subunit